MTADDCRPPRDTFWLWVDGRRIEVVHPDRGKVFGVEPRGAGRAFVWGYVERLDAELLEFLRAHWDDFTDAGWPVGVWFLNDCPRCGADSFEPCWKPTAVRRAMKRVHRERAVDSREG